MGRLDKSALLAARKEADKSLSEGDAVKAFVHLSHALRQVEVADEVDDDIVRQQVRP
jgi:hypothetical protein